ncbi:MAG: hypothetical protein H6754_00310 [Candidatus Omnitrophica bacterium]|nr:hypothetical protein [Candidatus Omnitrophota bacterium]
MELSKRSTHLLLDFVSKNYMLNIHSSRIDSELGKFVRVSKSFYSLGKAEVMFDFLNQRIIKSSICLGFKSQEFTSFPKQGAIKLSRRPASSKPDSSHYYFIKVHPFNETWFYSYRDYNAALAFAYQLAQLLSFPFENHVQVSS